MGKTIPTRLDAASPAFAHLSDLERRILGKITLTCTYDKGEHIFSEGEPSQYLWFLERGRVRLYKTAPDGHELTVCIVRTTDRFCLGTCPLFDGESSPISAQALEPVTLRLLNKNLVAEQMIGDAELGMAFGKMMADRYRHFARLTSALALHCIRVRVAAALVEYAHTNGVATARGVEMDLDLTQELVASCVGTDRAVIARTLLQFERQGLLQADGKHITLFDLPQLEQLIGHESARNV
ncbi:MAG: Crp/Fnr family transcriptional regulator [Anaerolineae bacterium]|nr:Crp/Fnr family transcriptional regulator [Anaerolineae bacterium]